MGLNVNDREELIYLLTEAAEFEHTVMCAYLYAQWTLKRDESEGITSEEKEAIGRWRVQLRICCLGLSTGGITRQGWIGVLCGFTRERLYWVRCLMARAPHTGWQGQLLMN